jgi:hypothetical protein
MSEIRPRIIFSYENEENPIITTDYSFIKSFKLKSDAKYRYIHELAIGTVITLPGGYKAEITRISTNFYDMEYKNEGINPYAQGERHPYNYEIIYKLKKIYVE